MSSSAKVERSVKDIDPTKLSGLYVPIYISRALEEGMSEAQIIYKFGISDGQLLQLWLSFMLHNHWMQKDKEGNWHATEKGRKWASKYHL